MNRVDHKMNQNEPEWYAARLGLPTASNFACIMAGFPGKLGKGAHTYAKNIALETVTGVPLPSYQNAAMLHGIAYEPIARELYEQEELRAVNNGSFHTIESDDFKAGASPDGLIGKDGSIEIKCVQHQTHFDRMIQGSYDRAYRWQIQGQLFVTGRKWCDWTSFCDLFPPEKKLYVCRLEADEIDQENIEIRLPEFKKLVDSYIEILTN